MIDFTIKEMDSLQLISYFKVPQQAAQDSGKRIED